MVSLGHNELIQLKATSIHKYARTCSEWGPYGYMHDTRPIPACSDFWYFHREHASDKSLLLWAWQLTQSSFHTRVSHNQGYHLVCTWGQKWSFLHCPKNNCTWKSIDYSVWNLNFAKLSLIFIEIYKFENPSLTRQFRVGGATQCWYDIHFYWVLLMIIFNWTY